MDIILSNSSGKPIYEQIADQVKEQIMTGALSAGDALPSMRLLAKELRISVITTKRAYEELEREGFIQSVPGKGSFVASKKAGMQLNHLIGFSDEMRSLGLEPPPAVEIRELLQSAGIPVPDSVLTVGELARFLCAGESGEKETCAAR